MIHAQVQLLHRIASVSNKFRNKFIRSPYDDGADSSHLAEKNLWSGWKIIISSGFRSIWMPIYTPVKRWKWLFISCIETVRCISSAINFVFAEKRRNREQEIFKWYCNCSDKLYVNKFSIHVNSNIQLFPFFSRRVFTRYKCKRKCFLCISYGVRVLISI